MKKFRLLTAALCAVVLLCGVSVTAYASGGDEPAAETGGQAVVPTKSNDFVGRGGATECADFGGNAAEGAETEFVPTMWEGLDPAEALPVETAEPEENPFTPSGTGTVVDNATDEDGKEFFTITTPSENVFYLVIDRQRETENVYFLNAVTEADLLALAEMPEETVTPTPEPESEPAVESTPEPEPETTSNIGPLLLGLAVALIGGGAAFFFKVYRPKHQQAAAPEEDYDTGADYDDTPPWDEEDDTAGEDEE
ncbi:MAG: DUF4366 domain-containing protein [Oscillospiraceae bacterium]